MLSSGVQLVLLEWPVLFLLLLLLPLCTVDATLNILLASPACCVQQPGAPVPRGNDDVSSQAEKESRPSWRLHGFQVCNQLVCSCAHILSQICLPFRLSKSAHSSEWCSKLPNSALFTVAQSPLFTVVLRSGTF
eukprot:scpid87096/ scgid30532/ 